MGKIPSSIESLVGTSSGMMDIGGLKFDIQPDDIDEQSEDETNSEMSEGRILQQIEDLEEDEYGDLPKDFMQKAINSLLESQGKFKVVDEIIDSDEDDFEKEFIKDDSGESKSSDSNDKYLAFNEFQNMIPKIETHDVVFTSGVSHSTNRLRKMGDPTQYIIRTGYADSGAIMASKTTDKVGTLYRLKTMLEFSEYMSDHEVLLVVTLLSQILDALSNREEWSLEQDFVIDGCITSDIDIFLRYNGVMPKQSMKKLMTQGGRIKVDLKDETYCLVPIPYDKKKEDA